MYNSRYKELGFERRGLFELLSRRFQSANVLYPGCGAHITPSFYFHHVIYMDRSREAEEFFEDSDRIDRLIYDNKVYRQKPYYIFTGGDFKENSKLFKYKFDMLISLYTDDAVKSCNHYLKTGGIILSNNFGNEVGSLCVKGDLDLIGVISSKDGKYWLRDQNLRIESRDELELQSNLIKRESEGIRYSDNEIYYILKKAR